jgi:hypothetical protein
MPANRDPSTALLLSTLRAGDHVIAQRTHYTGTLSLFHEVLPRAGVDVTLVDQTDGRTGMPRRRGARILAGLNQESARPELLPADSVGVVTKVGQQPQLAAKSLDVAADYVNREHLSAFDLADAPLGHPHEPGDIDLSQAPFLADLGELVAVHPCHQSPAPPLSLLMATNTLDVRVAIPLAIAGHRCSCARSFK